MQPFGPVKKVIRRRGIPEYLKNDGTWTKRVAEAWVIENVHQAIAAVIERKLEAVELVYMVGDAPGGLDVALPLGDSARPGI